MGFKIMGVAFPQQFKTAEELAAYIQLGILEQIEITEFGYAESGNMACNEIYVLNSGHGTLVIMGDDLAIGGHYYETIKGINYLRFIIDENSASYVFDCYKDGALRSFCLAGGNLIDDEGEPLPIEWIENDYAELIFKLIEEVTGATFFSIEDTRTAIRYRVTRS